jgi:membrane protease YdiL (CAAX protease family)
LLDIALAVAGAILVVATAYGLAHGLKSMPVLLGSLASALAFTIGYALTHNLWWLILLHTGLPLIGALSNMRGGAEPLAREAVSA